MGCDVYNPSVKSSAFATSPYTGLPFCLSAGSNSVLQIPLVRVVVRNNGLSLRNTGIMLSERRRYHAQEGNTSLPRMPKPRGQCIVEKHALLLGGILPSHIGERRADVAGMVSAWSHPAGYSVPDVHAGQRHHTLNVGNLVENSARYPSHCAACGSGRVR